MKRNYRISKISDRGRLIKACDKLHFEILKLKRGARCEICGIQGNVGRFHILAVGSHPRLRYVDDNILLVHWMQNCQAHYLWHHAGPADRRNIRTLNKIIELHGSDYEQKLLERERFSGKMDTLYLQALKMTFEKELVTLKALKEGV